MLYGEKAGVPFAPVGIYDFTNRLVTTVETDFNGCYDVLLPSTNRINCPTPSGVCANMYRFVGNDPGTRSRAAQPELQPAVPHDRRRVRGDPRASSSRPTSPRPRSASRVQLPGGAAQPGLSARCDPDTATTPQLFAVSKPYVRLERTQQRLVHDQRDQASVRQGAAGDARRHSSCHQTWTDKQIDVTVPPATAGGATSSRSPRPTTASAPSTA